MKTWRVSFAFEKGGIEGQMDVRARRRWRALMFVEKKLRRRGFRPWLLGVEEKENREEATR